MARASLNPTPLPYTVLTVEEAAAIVDRWQRLVAQLMGTGTSWTSVAKSRLSADEYQAVTTYFKAQGVNLEDTQAVGQALEELQSQTAALPVMDIEVAWSPSQAFLDEILAWLRKYGPGAIRVHVHHKPELVGGLIMGYAGRVLDYSLATRLDAYEDQLRR